MIMMPCRQSQPSPQLAGYADFWHPTGRNSWALRPKAILACDFFTADLPGGTQAYVLAVIEHATRRIHVLGVTPASHRAVDSPAGP